jgi:hypothetical protein
MGVQAFASVQNNDGVARPPHGLAEFQAQFGARNLLSSA